MSARNEQRARGLDVNACKLATVRVPEWEVIFDAGECVELGPPKLT